MATIEQYRSGWVEKANKQAVDLMQSTDGPILETDYGQVIFNEIQSFEPLRANAEQAFQFIDQADICAVGERTCQCNAEKA